MPGRCGRCGKNVYSAEERLGLGKSWHARCFTCAICSRTLDSYNLAENRELNEIFCKTCYRMNFATKGYGYGANEPTLFAFPLTATRSCSSSSLGETNAAKKNTGRSNESNANLKNSNALLTSRPIVASGKGGSKKNLSGNATPNNQQQQQQRPSNHKQKSPHYDRNINYNNSDDSNFKNQKHKNKHKNKHGSPSPQRHFSPNNSSTSHSSTLMRNATVDELRANYRTQSQVNFPNNVSMKNSNRQQNLECPSEVQNSDHCSRGGMSGSCYVPAPRYPPKHPQVHRRPLNPPSSFRKEGCPSTAPSRDNVQRYNQYEKGLKTRGSAKNVENPRPSKDKAKSPGVRHTGSKRFGGGEPCKRCGRPVFWAEMKLGTAGVYHNECYCCCCCGKNVESTTVSENQGEIFCKGCYRRFFGLHGIGFNNTLQTP